MLPLLSTWIDSFVVEPLRQVERERREHQDDPVVRRSTIIVFCTFALLLVFREEIYRPEWTWWRDLFGWGLESGEKAKSSWVQMLNRPENARAFAVSYWCLWQVLIYLLLPIAIVKLLLRQKLSDYGLKLRGMFRDWWVYALMLAVILPLVLLMAQRDSFQETYPFFRPPRGHEPSPEYWQRFWAFELTYALHFISLEFFFRGFILHGTRKSLGAYSIFVMMIPYCMIHFTKPLPETLGSLVAGLVLGFMSLRTRSVWLGAGCHVTVALSMDLLAVYAISFQA